MSTICLFFEIVVLFYKKQMYLYFYKMQFIIYEG
jgi:hypothetical protein